VPDYGLAGPGRRYAMLVGILVALATVPTSILLAIGASWLGTGTGDDGSTPRAVRRDPVVVVPPRTVPSGPPAPARPAQPARSPAHAPATARRTVAAMTPEPTSQAAIVPPPVPTPVTSPPVTSPPVTSPPVTSPPVTPAPPPSLPCGPTDPPDREERSPAADHGHRPAHDREHGRDHNPRQHGRTGRSDQ